ncbi:MAG TPA: DUF308 domain-containing protein [Acidimicrobiales bacterium]|nr:DUF308 domain-containing protein [Acidimicrobiales bacterium]
MTASLVWRGIFAIAIGVIAIVWPGITVGAFVILFAVAAFASSIWQAVRAFSSGSAGPVIGHLLLAVVDAAAGVVALAWPGITAYVLTIWIGAWAVVTGALEFGTAFASGEAAGERALFLLGGLVSIALGVVLFARPRLGAVSLAEVFGLFSLIYGAWAIVAAIELHHVRHDIGSMAGA